MLASWGSPQVKDLMEVVVGAVGEICTLVRRICRPWLRSAYWLPSATTSFLCSSLSPGGSVMPVLKVLGGARQKQASRAVSTG